MERRHRPRWHAGVDPGSDGQPEPVPVLGELQWLGRAFNDKLEFVAGLYYFKENGFVHDFVPFQGLLYVYDYQNDVDTKSYAGFLHLDYKFTDHFSA